MTTQTADIDKKGLIAESYRIEGIGAPECRSIFLDWAMSLPDGVAPDRAAAELLAKYGAAHPDHPMTAVLRTTQGEGAAKGQGTGRRGGRAARTGQQGH